MSCRQGESLLSAGRESEFSLHRETCAVCEALGRDVDARLELAASLRVPVWSPSLREALLTIPSRTVSCEAADEWIARSLDGELAARDRARLDFHVTRCEGCQETAATFGVLGELVSPAAAPWMAGRLAATRPTTHTPTPSRRAAPSSLAWLWSPRGAIGLAYAAAVVMMLIGFNPADLARGGSVLAPPIERGAEVAARSVREKVADRIGALQEDAIREFAVLRGRAGGYGRAVVANAIARFMKTETPEKTRPAPGESSGQDKQNETHLRTWRA
ncbi:MAG TPA: zf-HC2 domain-containing protein [Thermoanaerobaculia bacterium]